MSGTNFCEVKNVAEALRRYLAGFGRLFLIIAVLSVIVVMAGCGCGGHTYRWEFCDLAEWRDGSQNNSPRSYAVSDGMLRISTRGETRDRVKVRTADSFGAGKYTWRLFVPEMGKGDQASIGAFLYKDDKHELDFEIGYGKATVREKLKATNTDLVCYCTCQEHPFSSSEFLIESNAWHTISIDVGYGEDNNYLIKWFINDKQAKQLQTTFGDEIAFTVFCSVENLLFIGDHIPTQDNYAIFDYVEFEPAKPPKE